MPKARRPIIGTLPSARPPDAPRQSGNLVHNLRLHSRCVESDEDLDRIIEIALPGDVSVQMDATETAKVVGALRDHVAAAVWEEAGVRGQSTPQPTPRGSGVGKVRSGGLTSGPAIRLLHPLLRSTHSVRNQAGPRTVATGPPIQEGWRSWARLMLHGAGAYPYTGTVCRICAYSRRPRETGRSGSEEARPRAVRRDPRRTLEHRRFQHRQSRVISALGGIAAEESRGKNPLQDCRP